MSHLRPLTVTWSSGGGEVGDNFEGLHTEVATPPCPVYQHCYPALSPPLPWSQPAREVFSLAHRSRRTQVLLQAALPGPALLSLTALCCSPIGACGLAFPSLAS